MSAADCFNAGCGIGIESNPDGRVNVFNDPDKLGGAIECIGDTLTVNALKLAGANGFTPCSMLTAPSQETLFVPERGAVCGQVEVDGDFFATPGTSIQTPQISITNPSSCYNLCVFLHLTGNGSFFTFNSSTQDQCFEASMTLFENPLNDLGTTRIQADNGSGAGPLWAGTWALGWASISASITIAPGATRNFFGRKTYLANLAGGASCPLPPSSWSFGTVRLNYIGGIEF